MTYNKLEERHGWIRTVVDDAIKKGFASRTRGWTMKDILKQFDDIADRMYARKYIIKDLCSIDETSYK